MGLDMYLSARQYLSKYSGKKGMNKKVQKLFPEIPKDYDMGSVEVKFGIGYWRKANHIHSWFVENCQNGEDDCGNYYVSRENLEELKSNCETALKILSEQKKIKITKKDKFTEEIYEIEIYEDTDEVRKILPTIEGFFFGGNEIDEWYFQALEETIKIINKCLKLSKDWSFEYHSSW